MRLWPHPAGLPFRGSFGSRRKESSTDRPYQRAKPPRLSQDATAFTKSARRDPRPRPRMSLPPPSPIMSTSSSAWKSKKFGVPMMEGRAAQISKVKRWDGAARSCSDWDNLRRDPELWFRGGNCFVHLYGKGQSRRGPAFKVPFGALLSAQCHPLVRKFMSREASETAEPFEDELEDLDRWNALNPHERVELYIPAPPLADKQQAFSYHLATRNLFAWIFRRSMVGEHLGDALIQLFNSMAESRSPGEDSVTDIVSYLDEEGYMDIKGQPHHALALLHLAETFQLRDMYIDAFSHCVGMSEELFCNAEYQHISSISRTLIRRARSDMNSRLSEAGTMLKTFLEEELSETNLGLPAGGRAHLDRFRAFILSFYNTRLGYYPPLSLDSRSTIFDPEIFEILRKDFRAVYQLLVDEEFTSAESSPLLAQGGVCAVQSVHDFDDRCNFESLKHPLPLLPELLDDKASRRMSLQWLANTARGDKLKPDHRLLAHAALTKAMNFREPELVDNEFVRAYRKFEEDSVAPHTAKNEKTEKISPVDGRKVRWILIYAVYQVLRNCTQPPPEVRDTVDADYHLAVSTEQLPPWKNKRGLKPLRPKHLELKPQSQRSMSVVDWELGEPASPALMSPSIVIQPDVDYVAKSRRDELARRQSVCAASTGSPSRSRSVSRNSPFRRTLSIFRKNEEEAPPAPRKVSYCEIVVHGYGNGTNAVTVTKQSEPESELSPTAAVPRSFSTCSESSRISEASAGGVSYVTAESSAPPTSPESPDKNWPNQDSPMLSPIPLRGRRRVREVLSYTGTPRASSSEWSNSRRHSVIGDGSYAADYEELIKESEAQFHRHELEPLPLQIRKVSAVNVEASIAEDVDMKPEWEQFKDLGGLMCPTPLNI